MLSQLGRTLREHDLLAPGERVLVGVSGGPDSMALLHALHHLSTRLSVGLCAATVDHGLRPESAAEASLVEQRCLGLGVPCEVLKVDVRAARGPHVSLQEAARKVRLQALEDVALRQGCTRVALAHTADDQAETVLFRILRGTGLAGLAGIPYRRGIFIRPLLDVRRRSILAYLGKRHIPFIEDPSNRNRHYARVRIRHDILPALAQENPKIVEALLALAHQARALPPAREEAAPVPKLAPRTAALVQRLAAEGRGTRRISISEGEVVISYGKLAFRPSRPATEAIPSDSALAISGPGTYRFLGQEQAPVIEISETQQVPVDGAAFDAAQLRFPLQLRTRRTGDRMRPRGGRGSRKLSDLLVDSKIPREERAHLPVLTDAQGTILFVAGLRPSEIARPSHLTSRWIVVRALQVPTGNYR
jgi:tRNA(Ile)-lysidine synthase